MGRKKVAVSRTDANWARAVSLEPQLAELEREIRALPDPLPRGVIQPNVWAELDAKSRLLALVGWERGGVSPESVGAALKLCQTPEGRQALVQSGQNQPALSADEEWLQSSEAYEAAIVHLWQLLLSHSESRGS